MGTRRELLWLVVVPFGLAVFATVAVVRDMSDASASACWLAIGAGAVGLLIPPMLAANDLRRSGESSLRRWFAPLLFVAIGAVPLISLAGQQAEGWLFAAGAGFLVSFAAVVLVRARLTG